MNRMNLILWLSIGVVVGWLASRMFELEPKQTHVPMLD